MGQTPRMRHRTHPENRRPAQLHHASLRPKQQRKPQSKRRRNDKTRQGLRRTAIPAITILAGERSASGTFTLTPKTDSDGTEGTEQIVIRGDGVIRYIVNDGHRIRSRGQIIHPEARIYLTGPYDSTPTAHAVALFTDRTDIFNTNIVTLDGRSSRPYGRIVGYQWE